jgi:hypothetical protein
VEGATASDVSDVPGGAPRMCRWRLVSRPVGQQDAWQCLHIHNSCAAQGFSKADQGCFFSLLPIRGQPRFFPGSWRRVAARPARNSSLASGGPSPRGGSIPWGWSAVPHRPRCLLNGGGAERLCLAHQSTDSSLRMKAPPAGLEPATTGLEVRSSIQLSYEGRRSGRSVSPDPRTVCRNPSISRTPCGGSPSRAISLSGDREAACGNGRGLSVGAPVTGMAWRRPG